MVVIYNLSTKIILGTEDNTMEPVLPMNMSLEQKIQFYKSNNKGIISLPYELGSAIWNYKLCFNEEGQFVGLQPKGEIK